MENVKSMNATEFRDAIKGQLKANRILQSYEMDLRTWEILCLIALDEGEGVLSLAKKHKISKSAFSRHVLFLCGERAAKGNQKPESNVTTLPKKLIERRADAVDVRRQNLFLTREGESLIKKVFEAISE